MYSVNLDNDKASRLRRSGRRLRRLIAKQPVRKPQSKNIQFPGSAGSPLRADRLVRVECSILLSLGIAAVRHFLDDRPPLLTVYHKNSTDKLKLD